MASYKVAYYCVSNIGRARKINQDNFIADGIYLKNHEPEIQTIAGSFNGKTPCLLGIFDGMGGEEQGEAASLIASECASRVKIGEDPVSSLLRLCEEANQRICDYARENGVGSMGTTGAMLAFTKDQITLCNIGDSRIFRFADGALVQISVDHTAPYNYGGKPPLSQNLGIPPEEMRIEPYVAQGQYNNGDIFLICSDGLTDMVSEEDIIAILKEYSLDRAIAKLLNAALENGGRDNVTIILCKVKKKGGFFGLFG